MRKHNKSDYIQYSYTRKRNRGGKVLLCFFVALIFAVVAGFVSAYFIWNAEKEEPFWVTDTTEKKNWDSRSEEAQEEISQFLVVEGAANRIIEEAKAKAEAEAAEKAKEEALKVKEIDTRVPTVAKGIYIPVSKVTDAEMMQSVLDMIDETELNAVVIDIKDDDGRILFQSNNQMAITIGASLNRTEDIKSLLATLKAHNVYCIARIVAFKDPYLAKKREDLAVKRNDGTMYRDNSGICWLNPYKEEVWEYLVSIAKEAGQMGFQEVQFDYIRFSTGNGINDINFNVDGDERTKEDVILAFTNYAYTTLKKEGIFVSADVYGTIISSKIDAKLVGQNYVEMAKYLDYICPMIYPSHFGDGNYGIEYPDLQPEDIVRKVLMASSDKLAKIPEDEHCAKVRPWLQDFTATWLKHYQKYTAKQIIEQKKGVYDAGYEEWILWNSVCKYTRDGLETK